MRQDSFADSTGRALPFSVLILAGGTGGHVIPALAVAEEMVARGWAVQWMGTCRGIEHELVPEAGLPLHRIPVSGLRGRGLARWALAPVMLGRALARSLRVIARLRPHLVLGMGGFVSGPGGLAAWLLRRPLVIHEQNAVAGLTNRLLRPLAVRILEAFPGSFTGARAPPTPAPRRGPAWIGNPVRPAIAAMPDPADRLRGRSAPLRVAVVGGSQGAEALNRAVPAAAALLGPEVPLALRHQCGRANVERTRARYAGVAQAEVEAFYRDMAELYGWADVVICRAGAMTVSELAAAGVASILVPYPHAAGDHQTANARYLGDHGAAIVLEEKRATPERLAELLGGLARDRSRLLHMAERARAQGIPDAGARIVAVLAEVLDAAA